MKIRHPRQAAGLFLSLFLGDGHNAMAGDREKALEAGMNDHIAKPVSVEQLFAC